MSFYLHFVFNMLLFCHNSYISCFKEDQMARGRKPALTLDERLDKITEEIENMENSLKELKSTKKVLEEQIRMNRLAELDEIITASGKSIDEIIELLSDEE